MGGNPGSSLGCLQCRKARKKCGLEKPFCARCARRGQECSQSQGPGVFIHRDGNSLRQQTDRAALKNAYSSRYAALQASPTPPDAIRRAAASSSIHTLHATILADFSAHHGKAIFAADQCHDPSDVKYSDIATFIRGVIFSNNTKGGLLGLGVFSLLTQFVATFREDLGLKDLAARSYGAVLRRFHDSINQARNAQKLSCESFERAFALCVALHYYEMFSDEKTEIHIDGALKVLEMQGCSCEADSSTQAVFRSFRALIIPVLLRRRQPLLPSQSRWQKPCSENTLEGLTRRLYDLAADVAGLLGRMDGLSSSDNPSVDRLARLLQDFDMLDTILESWEKKFLSTWKTPAYWYQDDTSKVHSSLSVAEDPGPQSAMFKPTRLEFADKSASGILARYWSLRLEFLVGLKDVLCLLSWASDRQLVVITRVELVNEAARVAAWKTTQAIQHSSSCLEGRLSAQGPAAIIARYHERAERQHVLAPEFAGSGSQLLSVA